jgi:hypothetical protein
MRIQFPVIIAIALAAALPSVSHAQNCQAVQLDPGFEVGNLQGMAPANDVYCFDLSVPKGQNVSIELASGQNVSISVPGYYDDRTDRMFLGDLPGRLEIRVFQLMRSATPQPFAVRIRFEPPGNG